MTTDPTTELMERVLCAFGGSYLSDLHNADNAGSVRRAVYDIPLADYPPEAWIALADYVMPGEDAFDSGEAAVMALLAYLERKA